MITKVQWSDKALSDRQGIFEVNARSSGMAFSKKENKKIEDALTRIKANNEIGRRDLHPEGYLYLLPHRYKILYRLEAGFISVERVFN